MPTGSSPTGGEKIPIWIRDGVSSLWETVRAGFAVRQYRDDEPFPGTGFPRLSEVLVIMMMDKAGCHIAKNLSIPLNIRIIRQPAHSPELNPVEHIWDELREKYFINRVMKSLDDVEYTLCNLIIFLMRHPDSVKSLTNFSFLYYIY